MPSPAPSASTESEARYQYGVLGVGEIAEAVVTGLCADAVSAPSILLSPRNRERAKALALRYPSVEVAADNQSLLDQTQVLVVSLRPLDRGILGALRFRAEQPIVSVMAGVSLEELEPLVAPARDLARAIPLPSLARRPSMTPIHPSTDTARALFERLGGTLAIDDIGAFEAMSAATATISAHLQYLATITRWLSEHGVAPDLASRYVTAIFVGVAERLASGDDLEALVHVHATPGGNNQRFAALLQDAGVYEDVDRSLSAVYQQLRAASAQLHR